MDLIVTLIVGGVIGWLASLIMGSDRQMGVLANILVGIVGSMLGHWLAGMLGVGVAGPARWVVSLLGAVLLIGIVRALGLMGRHRTV
jgi:uncharacterized membrane protein YeaQ/YmgE (transglycosylase-associated protein family)